MLRSIAKTETQVHFRVDLKWPWKSWLRGSLAYFGKHCFQKIGYSRIFQEPGLAIRLKTMEKWILKIYENFRWLNWAWLGNSCVPDIPFSWFWIVKRSPFSSIKCVSLYLNILLKQKDLRSEDFGRLIWSEWNQWTNLFEPVQTEKVPILLVLIKLLALAQRKDRSFSSNQVFNFPSIQRSCAS